MDDGGEQHLLWAREPVSGWCYARLYAGVSPQLLTRWTNEVLAACPADIQSVETFGLAVNLPEHNVTVKVHSQYYLALQATVPLREIIPRVNSEPAGALLIQLCEFYNRGKAQKSWESVRRRRFWKRCGVTIRRSRARLPVDGRYAPCRSPPQSGAQSALIVDHRLNQPIFCETGIVQIKRLIQIFFLTHQVACAAHVKHLQQLADRLRIRRRLQIQHHFRIDAVRLQQIQRLAALGAARVMVNFTASVMTSPLLHLLVRLKALLQAAQLVDSRIVAGLLQAAKLHL